MMRFLSISFCNYFFNVLKIFIFFYFTSISCEEVKPLDGLDKLHSSLEKISKNNLNDSSFNRLLNVTREIYDIEKMSKMIIGSKWSKITPKDKDKFINVFGEFIVVNYIRRFSKLKKLDFIHKETKVIANNFILVKFDLKVDEDFVYLDYLMYRDKNRWKVFDILLDGSISEIATKKSDFMKIIEEKGFEGLISDLKLKNKI